MSENSNTKYWIRAEQYINIIVMRVYRNIRLDAVTWWCDLSVVLVLKARYSNLSRFLNSTDFLHLLLQPHVGENIEIIVCLTVFSVSDSDSLLGVLFWILTDVLRLYDI